MVEAIRLRVSEPVPRVRLRVLPSLLPTQIELRNTGTEIQWRYVDGVSDWQTLILVLDLLPEAADILAKLLTVDGAGSGLDADLLDGLNSTAFEQLALTIQVVTASGTTAVDPATRVVIVNLAAPGAVTLTLPTTASRDGAGDTLKIVDWAGNTTSLTLNPDAADTGGILGLASASLISNGQGLGTAASILLSPIVSLLGWIA